jgi:hypothetical protein
MAAADLGPWRGARLRDTALTYNGEGSDDDLPEPQRFARHVGRLLVKRRRHAGPAQSKEAISVFLLLPDGVEGVSQSRAPTLGDGDVETAGRIWFVSATAQSGKFIDPPSTGDDAMLRYVEEIGCAGVPAVLFNPRVEPATLRFYPKGLRDDHASDIVELANAEVTVERVEAILDRMWQHSFITPDAQIEAGSSVWEDASKHWAKSSAEKVVQSHIKTALAVALVDCVVRHEQSMVRGRVDIEIEQPLDTDPTVWRRPMEIEVKVLRERGSTGRKRTSVSVHRWIGHGIRQAAAYRDERGAQHGMLCCIDMRATDLADDYCPPEVRAKANDHGVILFRRFVYNSSDALRLAEYPTS